MSNLTKWLLPIRSQENARLNLICFPYAGSSPSVFRHWNLQLPDWVSLWGVRYPGRESRWQEPLITEAKLLAESVIDGLKGFPPTAPLVLFGHSLGAILAYEVALKLSSEDRLPLVRLIVSGRRAPNFDPAFPVMSSLPDEDLLARIKALDGTPHEVLAHEELMSLLIPVFRADFIMDESYKSFPDELFELPLSIFGGRKDTFVPEEKLHAWEHFSTGARSTHFIDGGHFYLNDPSSGFFDILTVVLKAV